MAAYVCRPCDVAWPVDDRARECPYCGKRTFQENPTLPDRTLDHLEFALARKDGGFDDDPRANRVERYVDMGFTYAQAEMLADARDATAIPDRKGTSRTWTWPLYWGKVAKALAAGCSHDQAILIFT